LKYNYHRYNYLPLSAPSLHLEMGREEEGMGGEFTGAIGYCC
jgi:hypothetical protein